MTNKTSAMRYARALLDVAIAEKADLDRIEQDLVGVAGLLTQYPALADALLNPVVPVARKRAAVAELTALSQLTPMVGKLIAMLADRDRLVLVADLPAAYRDRLLAHRNVIRAEITTTVPRSSESGTVAPKSPRPSRFPRSAPKASRRAWRRPPAGPCR